MSSVSQDQRSRCSFLRSDTTCRSAPHCSGHTVFLEENRPVSHRNCCRNTLKKNVSWCDFHHVKLLPSFRWLSQLNSLTDFSTHIVFNFDKAERDGVFWLEWHQIQRRHRGVSGRCTVHYLSHSTAQGNNQLDKREVSTAADLLRHMMFSCWRSSAVNMLTPTGRQRNEEKKKKTVVRLRQRNLHYLKMFILH